MTANKHTPGPWFVPDPKCFGIKSKVTGNWILNTPENCQLMAAAPELLEALAQLVALYDTDEGCRSIPEYINARAAIAKATGGQP